MRPKNFLFSSLAGVVVLLIAASCGLKGPLYRPDETKTEAVTPVEDSAGSTKKKQGEPSVQPPGTSSDGDRRAVPPGH